MSRFAVLQEVQEYVSRTGFRSFPQVLINGVPIAEKDLVEDEFENALFTTLFPQLSKFQGSVYNVRVEYLRNVRLQPSVLSELE